LRDDGALEQDVFPLLKPFARALAQARRIVILAGGASRAWPFERWRSGGEPLAQRHLAFGAGLAGTRAAPSSSANEVHVIADPTLDLPFARREGAMIREVLRLPQSQLLLGKDASVGNTLAAFARADVLHFAGHARAPQAAAEPALLLSNESELEAWEFFGLGRVPRHIVLSACDAGRTRSEDIGAGWGLAQVLLAAGATSVVAPIAPLADGDAFAFQEHFYTALAGGATFEAAFWHAQRSAGRGAPVVRLFVR
jgi:CHAT domain-containing protein